MTSIGKYRKCQMCSARSKFKIMGSSLNENDFICSTCLDTMIKTNVNAIKNAGIHIEKFNQKCLDTIKKKKLQVCSICLKFKIIEGSILDENDSMYDPICQDCLVLTKL